MKKIITISREFGAAGGTIGHTLAEKLGFEYYDKEIILQAARTSNLDMDTLLRWDEKVPANFGFAQSLFNFYNKPLGEKLYAAQENVIKTLGEKGRCVIVGRNANSILGEFENTLHVFIYADYYWRLEHMKKKLPDASEAKLCEELNTIDKARKKYCAYYTSRDFGVADSYDICLSSSALGVDACVDVLYRLAMEE
ncbi:MAG: cytidylate kinase-like family protein [Lachnospiraceae bacterium]|nr:cytidylate kinase-like family protein [Lachnospiraceae bacterium]